MIMRKFEQLSYEEVDMLIDVFKSHGPSTYSKWNIFQAVYKELIEELAIRG
jgi:hypothetical protein